MTTNYPQIIDGFVFSGIFGTRPLNGLNWYNACLNQMEDLRLAADSFRARQWIVPPNFFNPANNNNVNVQPGKTFFYEFQVKEGSWLWGMQFATFNNDIAQTNFSVVVRQGSDLPFTDRPVLASSIYAASPVNPFNTLYPPVNPLPKPRLIIPPCQLHVEISNDANPADSEFAVSIQLLLLFAEPK